MPPPGMANALGSCWSTIWKLNFQRGSFTTATKRPPYFSQVSLGLGHGIEADLLLDQLCYLRALLNVTLGVMLGYSQPGADAASTQTAKLNDGFNI